MKSLDVKTENAWNKVHSLVQVAESIWAEEVGKTNDIHDALATCLDNIYKLREIQVIDPYYR